MSTRDHARTFSSAGTLVMPVDRRRRRNAQSFTYTICINEVPSSTSSPPPSLPFPVTQTQTQTLPSELISADYVCPNCTYSPADTVFRYPRWSSAATLDDQKRSRLDSLAHSQLQFPSEDGEKKKKRKQRQKGKDGKEMTKEEDEDEQKRRAYFAACDPEEPPPPTSRHHVFLTLDQALTLLKEERQRAPSHFLRRDAILTAIVVLFLALFLALGAFATVNNGRLLKRNHVLCTAVNGSVVNLAIGAPYTFAAVLAGVCTWGRREIRGRYTPVLYAVVASLGRVVVSALMANLSVVVVKCNA